MQKRDLRDVEAHQEHDRDDAGEDRGGRRVGRCRDLRVNDAIHHRSASGGERGGGDVAQHLDRLLARDDVGEEAAAGCGEGDGTRGQQHDADEDRDVGWAQLGVRLHADRAE